MEVRSLTIDYLEQEGHLSGRAICFNEISNVLYDPENRRFFREVIRPEAITEALIADSDIRMLFDHDKSRMLARNNRGKGSLKVELREDGVWFDFEIPNTTLGHDTAEMIRRQDVCGCSFAFRDEDATWDFSDRSMPLRQVNHITGLYDLSIVVSPAYDQTSVSARSIEEAEAALRDTEAEPEAKSDETEINKTEEPEPVEVREDESYKDELAEYRKIIDEL